MEITNEELPFDSEDRALWRAFLSTRTGNRLLPKLLEFVPPLLEVGDTNTILVRTGKVAGYQDAARNLLLLTSEVKEMQSDSGSTNYPDLLDDSKWTPTN